MGKEYYREKIVEMVDGIKEQKKRELLCKIMSIIEVLPICECQRVFDYLSELYLS